MWGRLWGIDGRRRAAVVGLGRLYSEARYRRWRQWLEMAEIGRSRAGVAPREACG